MDSFGKSLGDIAQEFERLIAIDSEVLERQRRGAAVLATAAPRTECLLCRTGLERSPGFDHRGVRYVRCTACGHVQTRSALPPGYPAAFESAGGSFDTIYPRLTEDQYLSRRDRIYGPKLAWMLDMLRAAGWSDQSLREAAWAEFGSGAGYFLHAAQAFGATRLAGIEENPTLVDIAQSFLGPGVVRRHAASLAQAAAETQADIFAAWFVLEHADPVHDFWDAMAAKPAGTVLAFAVPCFGLATLLEMAGEHFFARNLDSMLHTQLYTDQSIAHALDRAGYDILGRWIFGQDATDFARALLLGLGQRMDQPLLDEAKERICGLMDGMQSVADTTFFSDARHVIALKRSTV